MDLYVDFDLCEIYIYIKVLKVLCYGYIYVYC